jgi:Capsule assembly protein Wzi
VIAAGVLLFAVQPAALARGVSPYLPLNLDPQIEAQIERVLILAGKPVMRRPIAAATVLDALPKACAVDASLCERVRRYLDRYIPRAAVTNATLEGSATHGADVTLPNSYGMQNGANWQGVLGAYYQPNDYVIASAGINAYEGRVDWTGSMLSMGFSKAQLDIGYKPHWLSPMTDSSMLMSSEAPTMPSVSLSNYEPLTRFGFSYEIFEAIMSHSDRIVWQDGYTSGDPRLGGVQLTLEPASGWSISVNRLAQFGGGARNSSFSQLLRSLFNPSQYSNNSNLDQDFSNQQASITSSFLFTGRIPFSVYAEYAGEDTSRGRNYLLGNSALSWGIHFPRLAERFDLTLEASEWQNSWYVNGVYQDGMTNDGFVTGNWGADQRVFNDGVGARSAMARIAWDATFGGLVELRYRVLENQEYGAVPYRHFHEVTLGYSRPWNGFVVGGELDSGSDVFGNSFTRLSGFLRLGDRDSSALSAQGADPVVEGEEGNQLFVDAGAHSLRVKTDLTGTEAKTTSPSSTGAHFALGARRAVSDRSDLGARLEYDDLEGRGLLGVRLIDYRYRFKNPLALGVFLGAARYDLATPAYGLYYGLGLQWRDVLPHVDVGFDLRYYDSVARDHLLPSDPQSSRPDSFYDISGGVLSLTYHF